MNIIITVPPIRDFYWTPHRASFLGVDVVLKNLKKFFKNVKFISPFTNNKYKIVKLPEYLNYLTPFMKSNFKYSFFKNYKHFGISFEKHCEKILQQSPDVLIISLFAFCYAEEALTIASRIKNQNKKILIVFGGGGVTVFPEFFEQFTFIDLIIVGEIEPIIEEVVNFLKNKKQGKIIAKRNTLEEELDFSLVKTFETKKIIAFSTILSRGCFKNCNFCANKLIFGKKFKTIPIYKIENYLKKFNFPNKKIIINFEDDNILYAKEYLIEVINLIKKKCTNILFSFENGIDYTILDLNFTKTLINLGIKQFNFSLVNINKKILENSNRKANFNLLKDLLFFISKFNIKTITYFIAGLPGDSFENILKNIFYLNSLPTTIGYSAFYPVPGLYEKILNLKIKLLNQTLPPGILKGSVMKAWFKGVDFEDLITGFILTRIVNELTINLNNDSFKQKY